MTGPQAYAGFWRRLGAQFMDALIFVPVILTLASVAHGAEYAGEDIGGSEPGVEFFIYDVLPFAAVVLLWWRYAATPGKHLFECRIVDAHTGASPRLWQAALRYLAYFASILSLGLGFLWVLWDPRKQGFHDKISRTVVVHAPEDDADKSLEELVAGR